MTFSKAFHVQNEEQLRAFARELAELLPPRAILSLEGDLGAGKTALARALVRHLAGDDSIEVPSPTFTLLQTYEFEGGPIWHFDMYRLKTAEEAYEIGWEEALAQAALVIVEWADRIAPLLPAGVIRVVLDPRPGGARAITVIA